MSQTDRIELKPELQNIVSTILQCFERGELGPSDGKAWRELARLWRPHVSPASSKAPGREQWKALPAFAEAADGLELALSIREGDIETRARRIRRASANVVGTLAVLREVSKIRSAAGELAWPLLKRASHVLEALPMALALAQAERVGGYTWSDGEAVLYTVEQALYRTSLNPYLRDLVLQGIQGGRGGDLTELSVILEVENGSKPAITDRRFDAARKALRGASINGHAVRLVILREACETPTQVTYFGYSASSTPPPVAPLYGVSRYFQLGVLVDGAYSLLAEPDRRFAVTEFAQISVGSVRQVTGRGSRELHPLASR
jgi:hypothetical protein